MTLVKEYELFFVYTFDLFFFPLLFLVMISIFLRPDRFRLSLNRYDYHIVGIFIMVTAAFVMSYDVVHSSVRYLDWVRVIIFYFLSRLLFENTLSEKTLANLFIFSGLFLLSVGLIQIVTNSSFGLIGNYFGQGSDQMGSFSVPGEERARRISGTTTNSVRYALWIVIFCYFIVVRLFVDARYLRLTIFSGISFIVLLYTASRGAILSFVVLMLLLALMLFRRHKNETGVIISSFVIISTVFVFSAAQIVPPGSLPQLISKPIKALQTRVDSSNPFSDEKRTKNYLFGLELMMNPKYLVFGIGPGTYHQVAFANGFDSRPNTWRRDYSKSRSGIHNVFMKLIVEYGVITFVLVMMLVYRVVRSVARAYAVHRDGESQVWIIYVLTLSAAFLLTAAQVYEDPLEYYLLIPFCTMLSYLLGRIIRPREVVS
jgi:O-antigen ligase